MLKTEPVGERTNFTQVEKIIDIITFEGNVGAATTVAAGVNSKYFPSEAPHCMSRFGNSLGIPSRRITYVIRLSPGKRFSHFRDPITFRTSFHRMHKLLFNNALGTLPVDDSGGKKIVGKRVVTSMGTVVISSIAHILAACRGLVVACPDGVFLVFYNRQNHLAGHPDTLGTIMALVAQSKTLLRDFNSRD